MEGNKVKLKIIEKNKENYKLISENKNVYELTLQFFDINDEEKPDVNDYINISAELLNPMYREYTTFFAFGKLDNICGKPNISLDDIDVIKIEKNNEEIVLKRLYG